MFRALLHGLAARLPAQCAVCRAWPAQAVCAHCVARFAQPVRRCATCALPLPDERVSQCGACLRRPPPLDGCLAATAYGYPWAELIARFKFRHEPGWADCLAGLMRRAPGTEEALARCDWLLPMPLTRERLRTRGFNQALELARRLAPARTEPAMLLRLRDTPAQSSLPREARLRNVRGAFAPDPLRTPDLRGRRVVLVDDVMTSGATLHAAAQALRDAGAAHVTGLVLARAE